jgi:glycyl-tRNA synthetase beta subunit
MLDAKGKLLPAFISVANIESSDLSVIVDGNERVIRPRLTDSEFFWELATHKPSFVQGKVSPENLGW